MVRDTQPKPAFKPVFEVVTTRANSGVILLQNDAVPASDDAKAPLPCWWWRRGRVRVSEQHGRPGEVVVA